MFESKDWRHKQLIDDEHIYFQYKLCFGHGNIKIYVQRQSPHKLLKDNLGSLPSWKTQTWTIIGG